MFGLIRHIIRYPVRVYRTWWFRDQLWLARKLHRLEKLQARRNDLMHQWAMTGSIESARELSLVEVDIALANFEIEES